MVQGEKSVMDQSGRWLHGRHEKKKQCSGEKLVVEMNE
jgi:hypothetical protein